MPSRAFAQGPAIDDRIQSRFPAASASTRSLRGASAALLALLGITALIAARRTSAAELVLPFLESDNNLHRFFAIYYLYAVPYPPAVELLARRLYDAEPRNRFLAADALRVYTAEPPIAASFKACVTI